VAEFMPAKYAIDDGEHLVFANPFIAGAMCEYCR
jgi:hypothetical protein